MAGDVLNITADNFDTEVVTSKSVALIDFYATWCGPCKTIAPVVDQLATAYKAQGVKVGKVDIDKAPELATRFAIQGVPTLIFFKGGKKVDQLTGAHARPVIEQKLKALVG